MTPGFISARSLFGMLAAFVLCVSIPAGASDHKSTQRSGRSGIEGTVLLGPGCPGPVRIDRPCPDQPYRGAMILKRVSDGKTVARTESDENGRFRVVLPPGRYLILNAPGAKYPSIHSPEIIVHHNHFSRVEIHADTGMR